MDSIKSTDPESEDTLGSEMELAQSTDTKFVDTLESRILVLPTPLWTGLMSLSTSTISKESEE
jgi:hypothetical protein